MRHWGVYRARSRQFREFYGFSYEVFAALLVGGILAAVMIPWLLFGERTSPGYGQVGLLPGDSVPDGFNRCTGTGRFADVRSGAKLYVTSGVSTTALRIGEGHLLASGRCEFPFVLGGSGRGQHVFEIKNVARWSLTGVDLTRPLELTVDQASIL